MKIKNKTSFSTSRVTRDAQLSPDGRILATVGDAPGFCAYQVSDGKLLKEEKGEFSKVTFSTDGNYIAYAGKNVKIIDSQKFKKVANLKTNTSRGGHVKGLEFYNNNEGLITLSERKAGLFLACVWELPSGVQNRAHEINRTFGLSDLSISPDGNTFMITGNLKGAKQFDLRKGPVQKPKEINKQIDWVQFMPDGKLLAHNLRNNGGALCFMSTGSYRSSGKINYKPSSYEYCEMLGLDISPNGKLAATIIRATENKKSFTQAWLLDLVERKAICPLTDKVAPYLDSMDMLCKVRFSPDSSKIILSRYDGIVKILELGE